MEHKIASIYVADLGLWACVCMHRVPQVSTLREATTIAACVKKRQRSREARMFEAKLAVQ